MSEYYDEYFEDFEYDQDNEYDSDDTHDIEFFHEALEDLFNQELFDLVVEKIIDQQENWNFDFLKFVNVWQLIDMFENFDNYFVKPRKTFIENNVLLKIQVLSNDDLNWYRHIEYLITENNVLTDNQLEQIHTKLYNNKFYMRTQKSSQYDENFVRSNSV